jgi:MinD-like ATPase involved in chromosome partitioning or flagellar assembly
VAKVICINSYRDGTGKTTVAINLAALLAASGQRVCLIDANFLHPDIHQHFKLDESTFASSLSDFLTGQGALAAAAHDLTPRLGADPAGSNGRLYLVPASSPTRKDRELRDAEFDPYRLRDGLDELTAKYDLDCLILDARAGLDAGTLPLLIISDILMTVMVLDRQDYQGTGVIVDLARKVEVPLVTIVVNSVTGLYEMHDVRAEVERVYNCPVGAVIPHVPTVSTHADTGILAVDMPDNAAVLALESLVTLVRTWEP